MTPYVAASAHHVTYLANIAEEPSRKLRRKLKEMLAVAISMVNGCAYCVTAHSRVLNQMFHLDAQSNVVDSARDGTETPLRFVHRPG